MIADADAVAVAVAVADGKVSPAHA